MDQPAVYYCAVGLWPCLTQSEWAAWMQAIGSLVAICVAIAVPAAQHWLDRRDRKKEAELRARSLAMALQIEFQNIAKCLNEVWGHEHQDSFEGVHHPPVGPHTRSALTLPPRLTSLADRLHELGRAGKPAQRCIYNISLAREYVTTDEGGDVIFNKTAFYQHLWEATRDVAAVLSIIDVMFKRE